MRILVTNDDGIRAPGLAALASVAAEFGEVTVVAPASQHSGMSHALTLFELLAVEEMEGPGGGRAWAVHGTPVGCVKLAFGGLLPERPDLVLSGINNGQNVGMNAFYSATVAAALEGLWQGVPSLAFSRGFGRDEDYRLAADVARAILGKLAAPLSGRPLAVSVNVPAVAAEEIRGVALTWTSTGGIRERYVEVPSDGPADGRRVFRLLGDWQRSCEDLDSDDYAFECNYVTVSPIGLERTPPALLETLKNLLDGVDPSSEGK